MSKTFHRLPRPERAARARAKPAVRLVSGAAALLVAMSLDVNPTRATGTADDMMAPNIAPSSPGLPRQMAQAPAPAGATLITEASFTPPLAIASPPPAPLGAGPANGLMSLHLGTLFSPETARIFATMTPEQIDALTLLLISLGGMAGGPAAGQGTPAAAEAPWIGNWSDGAGPDDVTRIGAGPTNSLLPPPWRFVEEADGALVVEIPNDPFSRITVQTGMIIGTLGEVAAIEKTDELARLRFGDNQDIATARHPAVLQAERDARALAIAAAAAATEAEAEANAPPPAAITAGASGTQAPAPATEPALEAGATGPAPSPAPTRDTADTADMAWVQVASFRSASTVARVERLLRDNGFETRSVGARRGGQSWRGIQVQSAPSALDDTLARLRRLGFADAYPVDRPADRQAQRPAARADSPAAAAPAPAVTLTSASSPAAAPADAGPWIQVARFQIAANASQTEALFRRNGFEARVIAPNGRSTRLHDVRVRHPEVSAAAALAQVRALGFADAYVLRPTSGGS